MTPTTVRHKRGLAQHHSMLVLDLDLRLRWLDGHGNLPFSLCNWCIAGMQFIIPDTLKRIY